MRIDFSNVYVISPEVEVVPHRTNCNASAKGKYTGEGRKKYKVGWTLNDANTKLVQKQ
jgi:hypothetical protein